MIPFDPVELARELRGSAGGGAPVPLFTERFPEFDSEMARSVAKERDGLRLADGDRRIGYKLGWTSEAMREALGIDCPNWGTVWASHLRGAEVDAGVMRHPKIEPELVYRAPVDLVGEPTAADIAGLRGEWALGLEIVNPSFASYSFDWLDNTADNSSCAGVVVGDFVRLDIDPAMVEVEFTDGSNTHVGSGSNAMGSPNVAVAWLVASLAAEGEMVRAGEIVFTGGLTAPFDVGPGRRYSVACLRLTDLEFVSV